MNELLNIGLKIRKARKAQRLTLSQLASKIYKTQPLLSAIENGKSKPSKQTLIALAKNLNSNFGLEWLKEYIEDTDDQKVSINVKIQHLLNLKYGSPKKVPIELNVLSRFIDGVMENKIKI